MPTGRADDAFLTGTALVTGGSGGIGFAIAKAVLERGGRVALIGTDRDRLDAALGRLGAASASAIGIVHDVVDGAGWDRAVEQVEDRIGDVSFLVLNAGAQSRRAPIEALGWDEWRHAWDVNVHGVFHGLRSVVPRMKARGVPAAILVVSSLGALVARPFAGAYDASKAAALVLAESLRGELAATAVRVSVLCPGPVNTGFAATAARHTPGAAAEDFAFMQEALEKGLDPDDVARRAIDRLVAGDFHIFTHPELAAVVRQRLDVIAAALASEPAGA